MSNEFPVNTLVELNQTNNSRFKDSDGVHRLSFIADQAGAMALRSIRAITGGSVTESVRQSVAFLHECSLAQVKSLIVLNNSDHSVQLAEFHVLGKSPTIQDSNLAKVSVNVASDVAGALKGTLDSNPQYSLQSLMHEGITTYAALAGYAYGGYTTAAQINDRLQEWNFMYPLTVALGDALNGINNEAR